MQKNKKRPLVSWSGNRWQSLAAGRGRKPQVASNTMRDGKRTGKERKSEREREGERYNITTIRAAATLVPVLWEWEDILESIYSIMTHPVYIVPVCVSSGLCNSLARSHMRTDPGTLPIMGKILGTLYRRANNARIHHLLPFTLVAAQDGTPTPPLRSTPSCLSLIEG